MGARTLNDISLGPVQLRVAQSARSEAWLEQVLGLAPVQPRDGRVRLGVPGGETLVELREQAGAKSVPRRSLLGLYHYAILLPSRADLGAFLLHLRELGVPYAGSDHLFSEALYLTDPDGMTVEVYADRPRERWTYQDEDIVGAVDPLDVEGLAREAGDLRWQGAPARTRMGHVHFYVGDLAAAERFYVGGLGFNISTRLFPGALFVAADGYHHHVGLNIWAAGHPVASDADAGLDAWTLAVPARAERSALAARLAELDVPMGPDGDGFVARDPWEIAVRVVPA